MRPLRWVRFGQVLYGYGSDEADATGFGPAGINLVGVIITIQYGYAGNDTLRGIETLTNQLYGGSGHDFLDINFGSGSVYGGDGNDRIHGFFSSDCLWGGSGRDTIDGDYGNDCIWGESGVDVLRGDDGNDRIEGGEDRDSVWGGFGSDTVHGGEGADFVDGDTQDDRLSGGEAGDRLHGNAGDDVLFASRSLSPPNGPWFATQEYAEDALYGGQGSDVIFGGGGGMTAYGEVGNDAFFFGPIRFMAERGTTRLQSAKMTYSTTIIPVCCGHLGIWVLTSLRSMTRELSIVNYMAGMAMISFRSTESEIL